MTTTRPDLVNLPELTNPTNEQTVFIVQDSGVNQKLNPQRTRDFLGNQIGPTGPQGPQGVQGPQGPQGVQGPQGPMFVAYSDSFVAPTNFGTVSLATTNSNHAFVTGNRVRAINSTSNFFEGVLTLSPDRLTFNIAADFNIGVNATNSWVISLTGQVGPTGPQGPQGVQGPTGPSLKVQSYTTATPSNTGLIPLVVTTSNHAFISGQRVIAASSSTNFFEGVVNITGGGINFLISADFNVGLSPSAFWEISVAGQKGATGPTGPQGVQGPTGPSMLVRSNTFATPDGVSLTTLIVDTAAHLFVRGLRVVAINTNNNYFEGTITNDVINNTTFIIQQTNYAGGVGASNWAITLTGKEGPQGPQGPINPYANTSTNIAGGSAGFIPIQVSSGVTAFIPIGATGTILASYGTTASWATTGSISVGTAATTLGINAKNYTTSELSPNKNIGIIDFAGVGTPSDVGVQASLQYNTNQEKMTIGALALTKTDQSSGTAFGALTVAGGIGVGQNIIAGGGIRTAGILTVTNATPSTSPVTGALQVTGGVGVGGDLYVAGDITAQKLTIEYTTVTTTLVETDDVIRTNNTTNSFNTQTGALVIAGGVGIGKDIYVGGSIFGNITTATNLAAGGSGQIVYQINTGQTGYISQGNTGTVLVARYDQSPVWQNTLTLASTTSATSTTTGALQVIGGVGFGQDLYVGGTIFGKVTNLAGGATGSIPYQTTAGNTAFISIGPNSTILVSDGTTATFGPASGIVAGSATTATNIANGQQFQVPYQTAPGLTAFEAGFEYNYLTNTFFSVNASHSGELRVGGITTITNTTSATNTQSGALQVAGGAGIGGDLFVGGQITAQKLVIELTTVTTTLVETDDIIKTSNNTNATNTASGALQVAGGAGFGRDVYIGGNINVAGVIAGTATTATNLANGTAGQVPYQTGSGRTSFFGPGTAGDVVVSGGVLGPRYQNTLTLTSTTASVSTQTGALVVAGGVGIGGDLYLGGTAVGIITSSTNLYGGLPGSIPYQSATNVTSFITRGITGTILVSRFDQEPVFQNTLTLAGTTSATSTQSGALQVIGGVGFGQDLYVGGTIYGTVTTATNLRGGLTGSIPYQASSGTTLFIPIGNAGFLLVSNGTTATWTSPSGLSAGLANTATNLQGGAQYQIPYQTAAGATAFEPGFEYNYNTDVFSVTNIVVSGATNSLNSTTGALQVVGGAGVRGNINVGGGGTVAGIFTVTNKTTATSTTTGALQVQGGASFQGDVYIWGQVVAQQLVIEVTTVSTNFVVTDDVIQTNNTTNSVSTSTGALVVKGGAGIGKDLYVGGTIFGTATNAWYAGTSTNLLNGTIGQIPYQSAVSQTSFFGPGTVGDLLVSRGANSAGPIFQNTLTLTATTVAANTVSGALQVRGGVGIGGDLYVGGSIYGVSSIVGVVSTATNIQNGTAGQVPYQTAPGLTSFYGPGTAGDIATSRGTGAPVYQSTLTLASVVNASNSTTGAFQVRGGAGIALDLHVGGNLNVQGGNFNSVASTFNILSSNTPIINIGQTSGTNITIGATSGFTNVRNLFTLTDTTDSTSTITGVLRVAGGAGIARSLYVGGTLRTTAGVQAVSTTSGDLQVQGGVGIRGDLWVGGTIFGLGSVSGTITTASNIAGGTSGQIPFQTQTNFTSFFGPGAVGEVLISRGANTNGPLFQNTMTLGGTVNATNTLSGTLQVRGGVGIGQDLFVGGDLDVNGADITSSQTIFNLLNTNVSTLGFAGAATYILIGNTTGATTIRHQFTLTNTTAATNTLSGALRVAGGAGIGQDLYVGGTLRIVSNIGTTSTSAGSLQVLGGAGISENLVVAGQAKIAGITTITNLTNAISTTTGALQVAGGASIGGDLRVQGTIYGVAGVSGVTTTASNIALGTAGQVPYQQAPGVTNFFGPGTGGDVLVSNGTAAPNYQNTLTLASLTAASSTLTGALQVRGGVGIGGNVYIGQDLDIAGGDITSALTSFNILPNNVTTLNLGGSASALTLGNTTGFTAVRNQLTVTNTTNAINATSGALRVQGGAGIELDLYVGGRAILTQVSTVTDVTNATSTATGAFQVRGGAGIGRDLWVGGTIFGNVTGAAASSATSVISTSGAALHYLTFVDSNNASLSPEQFYTTSTFSITPVTGNIQISGITTVTNVTSATSTGTGALRVVGGVGVGGSMYLNGYLQVGFSAAAGYSTGTNGEIRATNEITAYYSSDINLKENIRLITDPITLVNQIRGVFFDWKEDYISSRGGEDGFFVRKSDVGVIAQEVEKILPEIVATRDNGYKAVRYEKIVPLLIEAVKALHAEIEELKKKFT